MSTTPKITKRNIAALLRGFLLAKASVTDKVGDNIVTAHNFDPSTALDYPRVIVDLTSGTGRYQGGLQAWNVEIYAYSDESQDEADAVYDAVYLALQAERLYDEGGTISAAGSAREVERPIPGYNEQTRAWFARGTWIVMAAG